MNSNIGFTTQVFTDHNKSFCFFVDVDHWPLGSYTMPKPKSGCPHTGKTTWKEAWRFQDLENDAKQGSKFSSNFHMDAKIVNNDLERGFCTNSEQGVQEPWPVGN